MNRKTTNTMPINSEIESSGRLSLEVTEPYQHNSSFDDLRPSSKRKAADCGTPTGISTFCNNNIRASNLGHGTKSPPSGRFEDSVYRNERSAFGNLEYNEPESQTGRSPLKHTSTVDDLFVIQGLPKKRQRYQRRNSFVVRRDSSRALLASHSAIVQDIRNACFGLSPSKGPSFLFDTSSRPGASMQQGAENSQQNDKYSKVKEDSSMARSFLALKHGSQHQVLDTDLKISSDASSGMPLMASRGTDRTNLNNENDDDNYWGNASWANSEDTYWYSEFSSLSFDAKPTLPSSSVLTTGTEGRNLLTTSPKKESELKEILPVASLSGATPRSARSLSLPNKSASEQHELLTGDESPACSAVSKH